ncbi:uncharacterized protein LOC128285423 [Gossypium arboreum]|uniref:uncharacterized protein LOC128285423 n=1 Tax=Gossypium arboreum TaxID=29729 RepID=UPI0022F18F6E|nr:uncharacterized protein LOC128285423 [Gossypium arboreum]
MSARGTCGKGTRGRGRGRCGAGTGSSASVGDDALSQAMLRVLGRVAGASTGSVARGSISERLRSNGAKIFRGVSRVAPNVAEYWLEVTKRIMDDLDCTVEQKLKGAVSLLRDKAYQWWLTVREGTQANRNKTAAAYEAEFLRLSRYARGIVAMEYGRCVRFEYGLRNELRVLIAP